MKNVITELTATEDSQDTSYAALTPTNERADQFLYWLLKELTRPSRGLPIVRIPNTALTLAF